MTARFDKAQIAELGFRGLWRRLLQSRLLEEASAGFAADEEESATAWKYFCQRNSLDPEEPSIVPPELQGCPSGDLRKVVEREVRISKWKSAVFGPQASKHFELRKPALDRVVYSLLRVQDPGVARELWFRLKEGEATFAELAPRFAAGNEIYSGGIVGPVAFGAMHPLLAETLRLARPGDVLAPFAVAEWFLVARVEHHLPSELDEPMKRQMIEELATLWLEERTDERKNA